MSTRILDVTLRDGGYVNSFDFGIARIQSILKNLHSTCIEGIELGFLRDCEYHPDKTLFNKIEQAESLLDNYSEKCNYFLMIRPDWYDISQLSKPSGRIKNIRFAFHYADLELLQSSALKAKELGYNIYLNPVNITNYSKDQLNSLLELLNDLNPSGVSIVDTFGALRSLDVIDILPRVEKYLDQDIEVGFHPHDNLLLASSLSHYFIDYFHNKKNVWVDSSLMGIGRAPGNLQTELLAEHLNNSYGSSYNLKAIYSCISTDILPIKQSCHWGYHPAYAISASLKVHRSYPEYLIHATSLSLDKIALVLKDVARTEDKNHFSRDKVCQYVNLNGDSI